MCRTLAVRLSLAGIARHHVRVDGPLGNRERGAFALPWGSTEQDRRALLWPEPLVGLPRVHRLKVLVRWLMVAFILVVVVLGAASTGAQPAAWIALVALASTAALMGFDLWPHLRSVVLLVACIAIAMSPASGLTTASTLAIVCFVLVISRPVWLVVRILPVFAVSYVLLLSLMGHDPGNSADDAVLTLTPAIGVSVFLTVVVRNLERADLLHEDRVRTELAGSLESAARAAADEIRQVLHDHVLAALSLVQHHEPQQKGRVATYCGRVADGIDGHKTTTETTGSTLRSIIDKGCSDVDLDVSTSLTSRAVDDVLEPATASALTRALGEALRNCQRHSGSPRVEIRHESNDSVSSLVIRDEGSGFAAQPRGWGTANSISRPMANIGGAAHIHSVPGTGTTVTLSWPATKESNQLTPVEATYKDSSSAIGHVAPLYVLVVPLLLSNGYIALRYSLGDSTAPAELALAVCSAAAAFLLCARLLQHGPAPMIIAGILLTSNATVALGLWLAEPSNALSTYDSWCIGLAVVGPFILAFFLPASSLPLVIGPNLALVALAVWHSPDVGFADSLGALNAASLPLYALVCGAVVRAVERALDRDVTLLASATNRLDMRARSEVGTAQLRFLELQVAPWLRGIAAGATPLGDAETALEAQLLAQETRDTLNLPGVLDETLRSRITVLRRSGLIVNLVPGEGRTQDDGLCVRLLDRVLDEAAGLDSVLLCFPAAGVSTLSVAPELAPAAVQRMTPCLGSVKFTVENDGLATTITFGRAYREHPMRHEPVVW